MAIVRQCQPDFAPCFGRSAAASRNISARVVGIGALVSQQVLTAPRNGRGDRYGAASGGPPARLVTR
jgi:hypothetical protein